MQHISEVLQQYWERVGICMFDGGLEESEAKQIAKDEVVEDFGEQIIDEIKKHKTILPASAKRSK